MNKRIIIYHNGAIYGISAMAYLCVMGVAWIYYSVIPNLVLPIIFLVFCFGIITMNLVSSGRTITLDCNGMEIVFLWIKKKYLWSQVPVRQLFESKNLFGYRVAYNSGMVLSCRKASRPKWMHPKQYCTLFRPFSYVVLHFPNKKPIPSHYLIEYEVDKEALLELLREIGVMWEWEATRG